MTSAPADLPEEKPRTPQIEGSVWEERLDAAERRAVAAEHRTVEAERRAEAAESEAAALRRDMAMVMDEIRQADAEMAATASENFELFDAERPNSPRSSQPTLSADGSDPAVLPVAFGGTAFVAGLGWLAIALSGGAFSPLGLILFALALGLGYASYAYRLNQIEVEISNGGVVYVEQSREGSTRFDLRSDKTSVTMRGRPGSDAWAITFRGPADHFTVIPGMVSDPEAFTQRVREFVDV